MCCCWKVHSGLFVCLFFFKCRSFGPNHRSLCFDMLFIFSYPNHFCTKHRHTHTLASLSVCRCAHSPPTPFKCSPSRAGLASAFQLTLFPLQMTALTWEMSSSLCQHCLASSNICEVLSSSLQLRRAVS